MKKCNDGYMMKSLLPLLPLILLLPGCLAVFPARCTHPSGTLTGEIDIESRDGSGEKVTRTVISSNIALEETLCYKIKYNLTTPDGRKQEKEVLYTLEYDNLKHVYNYKNQYDFAIPATDMTCWCDCPGGSNQCDSDTDSCGNYGKNPDTCVNWYEDGQTLDGCVWITGSGQSCCSLNIERFSADTYRAVEISSPISRAQLRLNVISLSSNPSQILVKDKVYNVDLDTGTTADELVTMNIATSGTASLLPAGWYFGRTGSGELKTNVKINGLNEWNMNKLGWYKIQHGFETIRKSTVRDAFSATTMNCGDNNLETNFAADYYGRYPEKAATVESFLFDKVDRVVRNDSSRQVIAYHRSSPRLDITLTFNEQSDVTFLYDESYLEDFLGAIFMDKYSSRYLNITLIGGSGSIIGSIKGHEDDSFYVYIPNVSKLPYQKIVKISSTCQQVGELKKTRVCVKPLQENSTPMCKMVVCLEEKNDNFVLPEDDIDYERAEHDDILSLATWGKYLNPIQWFSGGKPGWVEGVVIAVVLIVLTIVVGIIVKLVRVFNCIFKCLTCFRQSKDTYSKKQWFKKYGKKIKRKGSLSSDDEV
ncbi:hypothetical protein ACHWQZ_G018899 [Mnemiopsis leidyi]